MGDLLPSDRIVAEDIGQAQAPSEVESGEEEAHAREEAVLQGQATDVIAGYLRAARAR